eukprot:scaffold178_cov269-Chaetoceros_neogracile.AAC.16
MPNFSKPFSSVKKPLSPANSTNTATSFSSSSSFKAKRMPNFSKPFSSVKKPLSPANSTNTATSFSSSSSFRAKRMPNFSKPFSPVKKSSNNANSANTKLSILPASTFRAKRMPNFSKPFYPVKKSSANASSALSVQKNEKSVLQTAVSSLEAQIEEMKEKLMSLSEERSRMTQSHTNEVAFLVEALDLKDVDHKSKSLEFLMIVREHESQFQEQSSLRQRAELSLESERALTSNVTDRLHSEHESQSKLKGEIEDLKARLTDTISLSKDASLSLNTEMESTKEKLHQKSKAHDDLLQNIESVKSLYEKDSHLQQETSKQKIRTLQFRLGEEERSKDVLEDRLTDEVNSLQQILNRQTRANADLGETLHSIRSEFEARIKSEGDDKHHLHEEIKKLQKRAVGELSAKDELSINISQLKKELDGRTNSTMKSEGILKSELNAHLKSESQEKVSLNQEIVFLVREALEKESREKNETVSRFNAAISTLESDLKLQNHACEILEEASTHFNEHLESERNKKYKLLERIDELAESLKDAEEHCNLTKETSNVQVSELQDVLIEMKMANSELVDILEDVRSQYDKESSLHMELQHTVKDLKERLSQAVSVKDKSDSELMEKVKTMGSALKVKSEEFQSKMNEYEVMLILKAVEKASLEDEIKTLQERLKDETKERDTVEARLSSKVTRTEEELASNKRQNDNLSNALEEARINFESTTLKQRMEKESREIEDLKSRPSKELLALKESLQMKIQETKDITIEFHDLQEKNAELKNLLEFKDSDQELRNRQEQEKMLRQNINSLEKDLEDKSKENGKFSLHVELLTVKHDHLQSKLVGNSADRVKEKASSDAQILFLDLELTDRSKQIEELIQTLATSRNDNEGLKDRLEAEIEKISLELTKRMKEKASYEAAAATIEALPKESNQERDKLKEELFVSRKYILKLEAENDIAFKGFAKNASEWETKLTDLSIKLAQEITNRLDEKRNHAKETRAITIEADEQRQVLMRKVNVVEEEYTLLQEETKSELGRMQSIYANYESEISDLEAKMNGSIIRSLAPAFAYDGRKIPDFLRPFSPIKKPPRPVFNESNDKDTQARLKEMIDDVEHKVFPDFVNTAKSTGFDAAFEALNMDFSVGSSLNPSEDFSSAAISSISGSLTHERVDQHLFEFTLEESDISLASQSSSIEVSLSYSTEGMKQREERLRKFFKRVARRNCSKPRAISGNIDVLPKLSVKKKEYGLDQIDEEEEIDNTNIESSMDLHSDDFQSTFGSNLSNINSRLPQNLMQNIICTDDSPGDSLDNTVDDAGVDRYSTTRLDTSSIENRTRDSTMGSAFGFKSAVDENEDIEQTMDPEGVQYPGSCSGSSSSSLDDDYGVVQPEIEQVVISVEQIVDPLPENQVPKVVSSSSDSIGKSCVTSKTNSIDGVSMQIHGAEEESGPKQMQKIAIVVTTVLDQMDTSVEAMSLSGESGSVFSVSSEETESSSTRYQRISALIPLSPENL